MKIKNGPLWTMVCLLVAAWVGSGVAAAATFKVNVTLDEPDAIPGDGVCSYDPDLAPPFFPVCTLRAAVMEGNETAANESVTILLKPGKTYQLDHFGPDEDVSATGDLDVLRPMWIGVDGDAAEKATVDAKLNDRAFQFFVDADGSQLWDLEIIRGGTLSGEGAALHSIAQNVQLHRLDIHDSATAGNEPGFDCAVNGGFVLLDSRVHHNGLDAADTDAMTGVCSGHSMTIARSTIDNNSGYGVDVQHGSLWLHSSTVSTNQPAGIRLLDASGVIFNSTLAFNGWSNDQQAQITLGVNGGNHETLQIIGSIIALQQENNDVACRFTLYDSGTADISTAWNLYGDASCDGDATDISSISDADIQLSELNDWGGPTPTHLPLGGDVIDHAPASVCSQTDTDQRGMPRPVPFDGLPPNPCDIGAVEVEPLIDLPAPIFADSFEPL